LSRLQECLPFERRRPDTFRDWKVFSIRSAKNLPE
jgi:hypothetical protein